MGDEEHRATVGSHAPNYADYVLRLGQLTGMLDFRA
jgi:hypothetical protein